MKYYNIKLSDNQVAVLWENYFEDEEYHKDWMINFMGSIWPDWKLDYEKSILSVSREHLDFVGTELCNLCNALDDWNDKTGSRAIQGIYRRLWKLDAEIKKRNRK